MPGIDSAKAHIDQTLDGFEPAPDVLAGLVAGLDCLRLGVALFDRSDRLIYCNEHFRHIYRSFDSLSDLIGLTFVELMSVQVLNHEIAGSTAAGDPQGWISRRISDRRKSHWQPIEQRLADGRWIEIKERPVKDIGIIGIWSDITARKIAQLRLESAIESSTDGMALWDQADRLLAYNEVFAQIHTGANGPPPLNISYEDYLGWMFDSDLVRPDIGQDRWIAARLAARRKVRSSHIDKYTGGQWVQVRQWRTRDGGIASTYIDVTGHKQREGELVLRGQSLERTVHELEMTQSVLEEQGACLVELTEELEEAKRSAESTSAVKSDFLATMSHELRTPLNAIIGFTEIMRDGIFGAIENERYTRYLGDVHDSASHLLALINDMLDLSKIEAGRLDLEKRPVRVSTLLDTVTRLMAERAERAGLTISVLNTSAEATVIGDHRLIKQMLMNLISNAIKFTDPGGTITLIVEPIFADGTDNSATNLAIAVLDSGRGIPATELETITQAYQQGSNADLIADQGTGLGLHLTRRFAQLHDADLELESTQGQGTKVTILFPPERLGGLG
ncbi:MAG: PAS-domain containing protein [Pseudomonadota bacterium]